MIDREVNWFLMDNIRESICPESEGCFWKWYFKVREKSDRYWSTRNGSGLEPTPWNLIQKAKLISLFFSFLLLFFPFPFTFFFFLIFPSVPFLFASNKIQTWILLVSYDIRNFTFAVTKNRVFNWNIKEYFVSGRVPYYTR